jgi:hypothetical protein
MLSVHCLFVSCAQFFFVWLRVALTAIGFAISLFFIADRCNWFRTLVDGIGMGHTMDGRLKVLYFHAMHTKLSKKIEKRRTMSAPTQNWIFKSRRTAPESTC